MASSLSGFGNPVSPNGSAALVGDLPHHISADAIQVTFKVDPDKARPYLPQGLELTDDHLGYAYVADMVKVSGNNLDAPHVEPELTQYTEGLVGLYCHHNGEPGRFSAFIWVSVDWSVVFGHYVGFAKKQADIVLTKIQPVNPAMKPIGSGTKMRGIVSRLGNRVMSVGVSLEESLPDDGIPSYGHRVYTYRHFPDLPPNIRGTHQLLAHDLAAPKTVDIWRGSGDVTLFDAVNEDLGGLRPTEIVDAYFFRRGWTTTGGATLIRDYDADGTVA